MVYSTFIATFMAIFLTPAFAMIMSASNSNQITTSADKKCNWLIVDFDGTCTSRDTTPILRKLASSYANDDESKIILREHTWSSLETEYFTEFEEAKKSIFNNKDQRLDLASALEILDAISTKVTYKVSASKVLSGIPTSREDMISTIMKDDAFLEAVQLRPGCISTLSEAILSGWEFGVLSINWSQIMINAGLLYPLQLELDKKSTGVKNLESFLQNTWSNEIDEEGTINLLVPGAVDKQDRIKELRNHNCMMSSYIVYIGDSSTDLLAMLEADVGILIGQSQSCISFAKEWGIKMAHLLDYDSIDSSGEKRVWMADNWGDIDEFLKKNAPLNIEKDTSKEL